MTSSTIRIATYHEYLLEGIYSLRLGISFEKLSSEQNSTDFPLQSPIIAEIHCRYAFLMTVNAIEAAANALLLSLELPQQRYKEIEKLPTLSKLSVFCGFKGHKYPSENHLNGFMQELITCRNEFVHPKPRSVSYLFDINGSEVYEDSKPRSCARYPLYFNQVKPHHALKAIQDTLAFLSYLCFDICQMEITEGACIIGYQACGYTDDIYFLENECKIKLDKRTFGILN